jgi:hypothetical protein
MKSLIGLTIQIITISALATVNATAAPSPSSPIRLNNLPKTCLPEKGRMLPINGSVTASDRSKCNCPPTNMCNKTINYKGKDVPKLPKSISDVCCPLKVTPPPPPPPPPPPVPVLIKPKKCEVHYYKNTASSCQSSTFIGTRISGYCSQYTAAPANPWAAKITSLNTCLRNTCKPIKTNISNINKTAGNFTQDNTEAREKAEMQAQIWLKDYVTCRRTCFNTSNFNNGINTSPNILMQPSEVALNEWIMLNLSDNVTDADVLNGKNERRKLSEKFGNPTNNQGWRDTTEMIKTFEPNNTQLNHFTAKTYGPLVNTTINQREFSKFFDNTYHPNRYLQDGVITFTYSNDICTLDASLSDLPAPKNPVKNQRDYFYKVMNSIDPKFSNLDTITNDHARVYNPSLLPTGITCKEATFFGMCITTFSNDGSCETCLSPDTKITMADDTVTLIKDLEKGDAIKAPYGDTGIIEDIINIKWPELVLYTINDEQLRLTADHPIMTTNGWRAINYNARKDDSGYKRYGIATVTQLKIGDIIVTEKGDVPVTRIMPEPAIKDGETFNLKLKDNVKGFYANGILVKSNE